MGAWLGLGGRAGCEGKSWTWEVLDLGGQSWSLGPSDLGDSAGFGALDVEARAGSGGV